MIPQYLERDCKLLNVSVQFLSILLCVSSLWYSIRFYYTDETTTTVSETWGDIITESSPVYCDWFCAWLRTVTDLGFQSLLTRHRHVVLFLRESPFKLGMDWLGNNI